MGACFPKAQTPMTATMEDINDLNYALKQWHLKETEALIQMRALCQLNNKFNGLVDPAASWKHTDISHGVSKYLDDMDEIAEERINRLKLVWRDCARKLRRLEEACKDADGKDLDMKTFDEIRTETLKDMLKRMIHCDMQYHALGLTKLTHRYNHIQQCTIEEA